MSKTDNQGTVWIGPEDDFGSMPPSEESLDEKIKNGRVVIDRRTRTVSIS